MIFRVHIAAEPDEKFQQCSRCQDILVDARGAQSLDGEPMHSWPTGGYVATVDNGRARGSVLLDHDAQEPDEVRCDEGRLGPRLVRRFKSLVGLTIPDPA